MPGEDACTLAERVDRIESKSAIADLVHDYARNIRRNTPEDCPALFAEDGAFEIRDGHPDCAEHSLRSRMEGRSAVRDYLMRGKGHAHPVPLIHNLMIEIDGETARSNCVMEAQVYGSNHKVQGEYRDTLKRIDGRWYFAERIYTIFSGASSV